MSGDINHKLVNMVEEKYHIYDSNQFRTCDFEITDTGVFLNIKCYNGKERQKYRTVRICLTDILLQIWRMLNNEQQRQLKMQIDGVISS